tara:strand:+ start:3517 stop:5229 length:1713 start_codon:yes stop_codon:yes gene_type:complete
MQCIWDVETNGLKPTQIWCLCAIKGDKMYTLSAPTKEMVEELFTDVTVHIGHNLIGYDIPVVERLLDVTITGHVTDTLILSRLYNPQLEGGHSLHAWGERLKFPKGDYHDWTTLTPQMVAYCQQDVKLTQLVYQQLQSRLVEFGNQSIDLEHRVQVGITKQIANGWLLDQRKASDLVATLKEKQYELEEKVQEKFKPLPTFVKEIVPKYKKDGSLSPVGLKFLGDDWTIIGGTFSRVDWPLFNLGSRQQIGRYLKRFGWEPKTFTETGQAIVDEKVLSGVTDIPEAQLIVEYLTVQKRIAQVQSWLNAVESDGRVHGQVNSIGAVTGRMTHSKPNMAQVPASSASYGSECRACWIVPKGHKLVGVDASGLELRMLAHYMDDQEYTKEILEGDVHTANQEAAGLPTRPQAKTFIYAFLYGAGDAKIGSIVGGSARQGQELKKKFLDNTPALAILRQKVATAAPRGYLRALDGRFVWVRSDHAALNTLLQSAGAIIMKKALALFLEYAPNWNLRFKLLGSIHDEYQIEAVEKDADKVGYLMVECIKAAGIAFDLKCPLNGEYKIGNSWEETH